MRNEREAAMLAEGKICRYCHQRFPKVDWHSHQLDCKNNAQRFIPAQEVEPCTCFGFGVTKVNTEEKIVNFGQVFSNTACAQHEGAE